MMLKGKRGSAFLKIQVPVHCPAAQTISDEISDNSIREEQSDALLLIFISFFSDGLDEDVYQ